MSTIIIITPPPPPPPTKPNATSKARAAGSTTYALRPGSWARPAAFAVRVALGLLWLAGYRKVGA